MSRLFHGKTVIFSILALLGSLLLSEIGTRVLFAVFVSPRVLLYGTPGYRRQLAMRFENSAPPTPTPENLKGSYTKFFPSEIRRDTDQHGDVIHATINSSGFRGKDFLTDKSPVVIRVIALGGSSTFGYRNRDNETYPHLMERFLNQKTQLNRTTQSQTTFEVINFGVPHLTSDQILSLFFAEALPLEPDIVTFYEGINDSHAAVDTILVGRRGNEKGGVHHLFERGWGVLRNHTLLARLGHSLLGDKGGFTQRDLDSYAAGETARFLNNLSTMYEECRKRGIALIVANQQAASLLVQRDSLKGVTYGEEERMLAEILQSGGKLTRRQLDFLIHAEMMRSLKAWTLSKGVPFLDVIDALDNDRDVLLSWVHLNPTGNRMIAREFSRAILSYTAQGEGGLRDSDSQTRRPDSEPTGEPGPTNLTPTRR